MQEILDGKNPAANIEIKPHDVISVSQGNARMVYVVGDVQRAGAFNLGGQRTISVLSAVSLAGGLGRTAKPEQSRDLPPGSGWAETPGDRREHQADSRRKGGRHRLAARRRSGGPHQQPQSLRRSCLRDPGRRGQRRDLRGSSSTLTSTLMSDQPLLNDPGQTPAPHRNAASQSAGAAALPRSAAAHDDERPGLRRCCSSTGTCSGAAKARWSSSPSWASSPRSCSPFPRRPSTRPAPPSRSRTSTRTSSTCAT